MRAALGPRLRIRNKINIELPFIYAIRVFRRRAKMDIANRSMFLARKGHTFE